MILEQLLAGRDLTADQVDGVFEQMLSGDLTPEFIAGFLVAMRAKGETVTEIAAAARVMRRHAVGIPNPTKRTLVDTCGTGGDASGTFNLSTAAAIVAAAAGASVAKHGNRSVSSKAGSADVLESLGVSLDVPTEALAPMLDDVGIAFLFAPAHHAATRHAVGPRKALGIRTMFNVLGPLTNPAGAQRQLLGVFSGALVETLGRVLAELGTEHSLVVHGAGGLDELSLAGPSEVCEVMGGEVRCYSIVPEDVGLKRAPIDVLKGGDADENAAILTSIFEGEQSPRSDAVAYSAGAALYVAGLAEDLRDGVNQAQRVLRDGDAALTLYKLVEATNPA
ncbi:MAG: anthranilate phosphoribosyltransferase [Proteobacteria bacterium]|nr:anthranilate phosphoribosyltransferase [Pseudomonadota bacterium]MCP4919441.1 anthranilate phosphoribosyltransferase [Pseudomonadota bacterium]